MFSDLELKYLELKTKHKKIMKINERNIAEISKVSLLKITFTYINLI